MSPEHQPAEAFHVGEYIADELRAREWTARELAERMGGNVAMNECKLDFLLSCPAEIIPLDEKTADGLARAFDGHASTWLALDAKWRAWMKTQKPADRDTKA